MDLDRKFEVLRERLQECRETFRQRWPDYTEGGVVEAGEMDSESGGGSGIASGSGSGSRDGDGASSSRSDHGRETGGMNADGMMPATRLECCQGG